MNNSIFIKDNKVYVSYTNLWYHKGHRIGHGLISPDNQHFWLHIPKCASTFTETYLKKLGWKINSVSNYLQLHDFDLDSKSNKIIVSLRNPIERWISGLLTYFTIYHPLFKTHLIKLQSDKEQGINLDLIMSLIFDVITFDDHTERQCMFLLGVDDFSELTYINVNENYTANLDSFLTELNLSTDSEKPNKESIYLDRKQAKYSTSFEHVFITNVEERLNNNDELRKKIQNWFECDYQLINQIKFYGG